MSIADVIPVVIAATFHLDGSRLTVRYSVENTSEAVVYLVNRLTRYEDGKGWIPDPAVAYVFFGRNHEIEVCKRVPPPPSALVIALRSWYVTPLAPHERLEETLSLPLPLAAHHPYGEPAPARQIRATATLQFVLGAFVAAPGLSAVEENVHGVKTHSLKWAGSGADRPREILLRSSPVQMELPVLWPQAQAGRPRAADGAR